MTAETIHTCSYECERPECIRAQRDELAARLTAAQQKQPAEGEDIMVNTPYDVFILPLRPSGLDGKGPRFVVHVPGPEQPAPQAQSSTEAWRDLAIAGAAIVEEIREIVGLKGKPGDVVKAVRELAAALEAAQMGLRYAVRVWVLSDEIAWSEEKIDEVVESIISDAKKEAGND